MYLSSTSICCCLLQFDAPAEAVTRKLPSAEATSYEGKGRSTTSKKAEKARRRKGLEKDRDIGTTGAGGGAGPGKEDTPLQSKSSQVCISTELSLCC